MTEESRAVAKVNEIEDLTFVIRDQKVDLDYIRAHLYGVETKASLRAVRRNLERFPDDFMLQLSQDE